MSARELWVGYEHALLHRWDLVAQVLSMLHNVNAAPQHRKPAAAFNPYRQEGSRQRLSGPEAIEALQSLTFVS